MIRDHLQDLYSGTDDPWGFRRSPYEQAKFAATRAALSRPAYANGLELGCGNVALALHLAPACGAYTGLDAVSRAVAAARKTLPDARFIEGWLPRDLPAGAFDLIVLSEILYFLDPGDLRQLAVQIVRRWPAAELVCVTWLGETGHDLQGEEALAIFSRALGPDRAMKKVTGTADYRIDRRLPGDLP